MSDSIKVLIVGAGIGGLTLGILLERIGINYEIFERASAVKPLGAAMSIGPNILPLFEQLGMLDEILAISLEGKTMDVYSEDLNLIGRTENTRFMKERCGFCPIMFSRPDLYKILLSRIPAHKITFNKRVLSVGQSDKGVIIRCADNYAHEGSILIGADGAYSAVRQSLYDRLQKDDLLPKSDTQALSLGYSCMVGTTVPLDTEKFPFLKDEHSNFAVVIADGKPHSWTLITIPGNRICFGIVKQLKPEEKEETFRNSEWGAEAVEAMISQVAEHKTPFGCTLGDLIEYTPRKLISKVYLEEKLFETWTHERIALIGDACHRMLPSAGQGAMNAMQDAVIVANCLYDLTSSSQRAITAALQDYKSQRYSHAKKQVNISSAVGRILYGQTRIEKFARKAVFNWIPSYFEEKAFIKSAEYRPQATFLPFAENRTGFKVVPQKPSKRYQEEQMALKEQKEQKALKEEEKAKSVNGTIATV
ncbi:hypothetical protein BGZ76_007329 [Entomortierella beljakovae]|nr:hypothetical protein BGZ76_007329 [Entomortierella beljakovae]